eukprot:jgi/Mesvir1/12482/Mv10241-RA.1
MRASSSSTLLVLLAFALLATSAVANLPKGAFSNFDEDEDEFVGTPPEARRPQGSVDIAALKPTAPPAPAVRPKPQLERVVEFPLEHSLDGSSFSKVGTVHARAALFDAGAFDRRELSRLRLSSLQAKFDSLKLEEQQQFQELLGEDGFYRLRVPANPIINDGRFVVTALKARCLADSGMRLYLEFSLDEFGHILALSMLPPSLECLPSSTTVPPRNWEPKATCGVKSAEAGPKLMGFAGGQHPPPSGDGGGDGEQHGVTPVGPDGKKKEKPEPEPGFFAKYVLRGPVHGANVK